MIYLFTAIGFPPGKSGRYTNIVDSYIQKVRQYTNNIKHRIHKIENIQNKNTNTKRILKRKSSY
jgi:hypothetical protein